ncbi:MAG: Fic family protein [Nanoarchaeota archaeon]|nr:Fic family protein [Nanoarchaeota archaeon]
MPTKYDIFAEVIEHAPCKAKDLKFKTRIYNHLKSLISDKWIKLETDNYLPVKSNETTAAFNIIKYCLKNGLDYNKFFSKNILLVIKELFSNSYDLRPNKLKGNKENVELLQYLERNQFLLVAKKKPRRGLILKHQLLQNILDLHKDKFEISTNNYLNLKEEVMLLGFNEINPFDNQVFSFLSGSAQLEGSTVTEGETKEIIMNDIYPDKPKKDVQMVKNLNEAMHYILENLEEDITEEHIKELNKLVMFSMHRNAGKYKKNYNKIQGNPDFKTAHPSKVPEMMKIYCEELEEIKNKIQCIEKTGYVHNELQHIHPFSDGNSRTTRMVLNWMLLKHKIPLLVIKMGCFDEYMSLTKLSKKRDDKKLGELFNHILIHENLIN